MPTLFELHERYAEKGLVIIGVHDDSVADVNELERRLETIRETMWEGKSIPYLVALDGGGEIEVPGIRTPVRGATCAAYGIRSWPTYLLIDKRGVLKASIGPTRPEHVKMIENLLNAPVE
jgi:hypothetical protein